MFEPFILRAGRIGRPGTDAIRCFIVIPLSLLLLMYGDDKWRPTAPPQPTDAGVDYRI